MGVRVKISSNLICIWIISNLLFIPSLKSSELIPSQSQVICHINLSDHSSRDSIDEDTFNLASYCENCNLYHDYEPCNISTKSLSLCSKIATQASNINSYYYNQKNKLTIFTRAPPNKT